MKITESQRLNAIQSRRDSEAERVAYMLNHMTSNRAYFWAADRASGDKDGSVLADFRYRYSLYRQLWHEQPQMCIEKGLFGERLAKADIRPLCVDIETAALCDLACRFCFRQWIATPDKIMKEDLYRRIIDQCAKLDVPSVKLNWRGEPLLHPKLPGLIDYAKRQGILETIINTNAVTLTEKKSRELIEAGLDLMIYSFDGGTKETYEKMRVGRFEDNSFEKVYENICRLARIRNEMGARFPRTKIQMILTMETHEEQEAFHELFSNVVDDVSVKAYSERGGKLPDLDDETRNALSGFLQSKNIPESATYWRDLYGTIYVSSGRLPCEQPFQRIMISYDGRTSMCCYDYGIEYPIGYLDERPILEGERAYRYVFEKAKAGARGYEPLKNIRLPKRLTSPPKHVQTIKEVWNGDIIDRVRKMHIEGKIEDVSICRGCPFKETYRWEKADF